MAPLGFGIRLRGLWEMRGSVAACAGLALIVAVLSVARPSGFPPRMSYRSLEMATASTQVMVDTPISTLVDIGQEKYGLEALTERAVLLGNVLASPLVRAEIARRAHVPFDRLLVIPPLTPGQPRVLAEAGQEKHTTDILKLSGDYRLYVRANPTVPFLQIYAQAPTAESAGALANAAVDGVRAYLRELGQTTRTSPTQQIRLTQLGRAEGSVINKGARWQVGVFAFVAAFAAACATLVWFRGVREGWRLAALSERQAV